VFVEGQVQDDPFQINYKYAAITVWYKIFPFGLGGGTGEVERAFLKEEVEATTELVALPYNFDVVDDSDVYKMEGIKPPVKGHIEGKLNKKIVIEHYKIEIPLIVEPNFFILNALSGYVNQHRLLLPSGYVAQPETMLYEGYSGISKRELSRGALAWTIQLHFSHNYSGWNRLPKAVLNDPNDINSGVSITYVDIVPDLYDAYDLNKLLYGRDFDYNNIPEPDIIAILDEWFPTP
jgi:hypothetical protein